MKQDDRTAVWSKERAFRLILWIAKIFYAGKIVEYGTKIVIVLSPSKNTLIMTLFFSLGDLNILDTKIPTLNMIESQSCIITI